MLLAYLIVTSSYGPATKNVPKCNDCNKKSLSQLRAMTAKKSSQAVSILVEAKIARVVAKVEARHVALLQQEARGSCALGKATGRQQSTRKKTSK